LDGAGDAIRADLSGALLRFHGRTVAADSAELEPWVELFQSASATDGASPLTGWRAVCIGLLIHPDFYSY